LLGIEFGNRFQAEMAITNKNHAGDHPVHRFEKSDATPAHPQP
jgi:hypothetical protein